MELPEGFELCEYVLWADLHSIELKSAYSQGDLDQCNNLITDISKHFVAVD